MRIHPFFLLTAILTTAHANDIVLKGGAKIQGPVLKQADDATVVDLGYDLLRSRDPTLSIGFLA